MRAQHKEDKDATPFFVGIFCAFAVAVVLGVGAYLGLQLLK